MELLDTVEKVLVDTLASSRDEVEEAYVLEGLSCLRKFREGEVVGTVPADGSTTEG